NIHASWLPRWRGAAPIQRAILAGDSETGISIMQMAKGLDTGDVLCLQGCMINPDDNAQSLHDKLAVLGAEAIIETLHDLQADDIVRTPQQEALATYAKKLTKQEAVLDWQKSASELHRTIRAYNPYPVAYTQLNDKRLRIWQAAINCADHRDGEPGTIIAIQPNGIDVACGDGVLRLLTVQWPGAKPQKTADILNAHHQLFHVGATFV
ncbi:MAG: methionyl-tRNA formyltransferase, partial [Gammaproteobacteria bacterium]|nr:methionyl-tRNA formyltransferase [Gammaproteobacteria bacterium]